MNGDNIIAEPAHNNSVATSSSSPGPIIQATTQSEFAEFSSRGRHLSRMTTEEAVEYYMDQLNARSTQ